MKRNILHLLKIEYFIMKVTMWQGMDLSVPVIKPLKEKVSFLEMFEGKCGSMTVIVDLQVIPGSKGMSGL